jgi:hypothetical protein
MKKLISLVALAAALMVSGTAVAASVNILLDQGTTVGGPFSLVVTTDPGVGVSQLAFLITGPPAGNVFTPAANGGANNINIVILDSVIAPAGEGGRAPQLQLNAPAGGAALFTGNSVVLGSLVAGSAVLGVGTTPAQFGVFNGDDEFGYTANDLQGVALDYTLTTHYAAPEPASLVLISLGLAGLAVIRRRAV